MPARPRLTAGKEGLYGGVRGPISDGVVPKRGSRIEDRANGSSNSRRRRSKSGESNGGKEVEEVVLLQHNVERK